MKKKKPTGLLMEKEFNADKYATIENVMSLVMKLEIEIKIKLVEIEERLEILEKKQKDD